MDGWIRTSHPIHGWLWWLMSIFVLYLGSPSLAESVCQFCHHLKRTMKQKMKRSNNKKIKVSINISSNHHRHHHPHLCMFRKACNVEVLLRILHHVVQLRQVLFVMTIMTSHTINIDQRVFPTCGRGKICRHHHLKKIPYRVFQTLWKQFPMSMNLPSH